MLLFFIQDTQQGILPKWLDGKESVYNVGDPGSILGSGRSPGEGNGNPLQVFLPGKSHGQRSLAGYSPWDCKEWDTTEQLTLSGYTFFETEILKERSYLKTNKHTAF